MQDWMFEAGGESAPWPEPQPQATVDASWFENIRGGENDWLTPLSSESSLEEVIVTAPRPNPTTPGGGYNPGDYGEWDGYDSSEPWLPQVPPPPLTPCELDGAKDSAATTIAIEIKAKPDWQEREYGALILRDADGYIYIGNIARGETVAEAQARATAAGQTDFAPETRFGSVPAGFTVIGVVHSHPDVGYSPSEDLQNRYPSDYPGGGDYTNFENLVVSHPRFSSAADFTQYILGPDGVLREFDFTEGRVTQANDTKPNRADLASDRPCSRH